MSQAKNGLEDFRRIHFSSCSLKRRAWWEEPAEREREILESNGQRFEGLSESRSPDEPHSKLVGDRPWDNRRHEGGLWDN